ncbi:MAG TPA: 50S ribosomal protein L6 [Thermoplasmata archaeon]|nr:50S ribosomal protein L6 [Thermoplasmata archaeon]
MSTEPTRDSAQLPLPRGVKVTLHGNTVSVEGPLGRITRGFPKDALELTVAAQSLRLQLKIPWNRKRAQALLHAWEAHLRNMAGGVTTGFEAKMKIVAAHFPMKVSVKEHELVIENFLGEKYPRSASLVPGVDAKVDGDFVLLSGYDVEHVGQSSANIERATRIRDYDPRVFQDGIYIVERAHLKGTN